MDLSGSCLLCLPFPHTALGWLAKVKRIWTLVLPETGEFEHHQHVLSFKVDPQVQVSHALPKFRCMQESKFCCLGPPTFLVWLSLHGYLAQTSRTDAKRKCFLYYGMLYSHRRRDSVDVSVRSCGLSVFLSIQGDKMRVEHSTVEVISTFVDEFRLMNVSYSS